MEITNVELLNIQASMDFILKRFRENKLNQDTLWQEVKQLSTTTNACKEKLKIDINLKKYPNSAHYQTEYKNIGTNQKNRATMLLGQPMALIASELSKGIRDREWDFCFQLENLIKYADYTQTEKNQINKHRDLLLQESGVGSMLTDLKQLEVLGAGVNSMEANIGKEGEDYFSAVSRDREIAELGYSMKESEKGYQPAKMD